MSGDDRLIATASQTVGPFFHFGLTAAPNGRLVDRLGPGITPATLAIVVTDGNGAPVIDAMIEVATGGCLRPPADRRGWHV